MSASEYTEKLHLPLFSDGDKPTWRGDVNDANRRLESAHASTATRLDTVDNRSSVAEKMALENRDKMAAAQAAMEKSNADLQAKVNGDMSQTKDAIQADVASRLTQTKAEIDAAVADRVKKVPVARATDAISNLGLDPTGKIDCSEKLQEFISAHIADGGRIYFPAGNYLFSSPITFARDTAAHHAPVWEIWGAGNKGSGTDDDTDGATENRSAAGGTSLVFACGGGAQQCMLLNTDATFYLHDLSIDAANSNSIGWLVRVNKSIVSCDRVEFRGKPSQRNIQCTQNAICFGTPGIYDYGGYGSAVRDCQFDRIAICVAAYGGANSLRCDTLTISGDCGSNTPHSAPIVMDGTGDQLRAVHISDVIGEVHAYKHMLAALNITSSVFTNFQSWDTGWVQPSIFDSVYYLTHGAKDLTFIGTWRDGVDVEKVVGVDNGTIGDAFVRGNIFVGPGLMSIVGFSGDTPGNMIPGLDVNALAFASSDGSLWYHFGKGKWEKITHT